MSELKPCPFCGVNEWRSVVCSGDTIYQCDKCGTIVDESVINTRPIEDALNARIAELEKDNDEFRQLIHDWIIILTPDDGYVPDSECNDVATPIDVALRKRIAELEGKIDQLIEAGDWGAKLAINIGALSGDNQYKLAKKRYDKWDALVKDWKEREE